VAFIGFKVDGVNELTRSFSRFPKDVRQNINNASRTLAKEIADESRKTAAGQGRQASLAAQGIVSAAGRVPTIKLGGTQSLRSRRGRRVTRGDLIFGAEFGSNNFPQFPPRSPRAGRGNEGYFFFPTVKRMGGTIYKRYIDAVEDSLRKASSNG
jgi:hypothetical protein